MTLMQRDRENLERGQELGQKIGRNEGARMMQLRSMGKSYEEIAKIMDTSEKENSNFLKKYDVRNIVTGKPMASCLEKPETADMQWSFYTQGSSVGSAIIPVTEVTTVFDNQKGFINKINKEERTYEN